MTVQQISRHAKRTRKPGEAWLTAIKRSSRELKSGKKSAKKAASKKRRKVSGVKKKRKVYQTGSSSKHYDQMKTAKAPGKRKSKSGRIYTERRKNRSDLPGKLTGIGAIKSKLRNHYEQQLAGGLLAREKATTLKQHKAAMNKIGAARKQLKAFS
jgi:hypothetical protein